MKKFLIMPLVALLLLSGCTMPTQKIAVQALDKGTKHSHTVFYDMSRIARQGVLDQGAVSAATAAENQDPQAAQAAVKKVFDDMNKIDFLHIQWERSRALIRLGQQYVWEQEGIVNILTDEFSTAKEKVENKDNSE
jgi:hypothetical protein